VKSLCNLLVRRALPSLLCGIFLFSAHAQSNRGTLSGMVLDPSGASVPNAEVTATQTETGAARTTMSTTSGEYRFGELTPGTYTVVVNAAGFKAGTFVGIVVSIDNVTSHDLQLQIGGSQQNVTVEASNPTLQTETSDIGGVITQKEVLDLPLALSSGMKGLRSPEAFVFTLPGTTGPGSGGGGFGNGAVATGFENHISGSQTFGGEVLLDGASTYRSENGNTFDETAPSIEALSEFKVFTSSMPAQYGRTTGGLESFNTKGGTNDYHGDVYEVFRNTILDANTWYNKLEAGHAISQGLSAAAFTRPIDKQNDYGFTVGGPVWIPKLYNGHNKTFFFISWEDYKQPQSNVLTATVPTAAERGANLNYADLSSFLAKGANGLPIQVGTIPNTGTCASSPAAGKPVYQGEIFDPTGATCVDASNNTWKTQAFVDNQGNLNQIPVGRISKVSQNILNLIPGPTQSGINTNNYAVQAHANNYNTSITGRLDQNFGENHKAFVTYSQRENLPPPYVGYPTPADPNGFQDFTTHFIRGGWDWILASNLVNHVNLGYNRTNSVNLGTVLKNFPTTNWDAKLGIAGAPVTSGFPQINIGAGFTAAGDATQNYTIDNGYRFNDNLLWTKGKHALTFGFDYRYQIFEPQILNSVAGNFNFGGGETNVSTGPAGGQTGNSYASFLLGAVDSTGFYTVAAQPKFLAKYWAVFVQDDFKIRRDLTLNLGLRWDVEYPRTESHNNQTNFCLTCPDSAAGNLPGELEFAGVGTGRLGVTGERWVHIWHKDFAPRVGFAYTPPFLHDRLVARGGYMIYYGPMEWGDFNGQSGQQGFNGFNNIFTQNGSLAPAYFWDSGVPKFNSAVPNLDPTQLNFQGYNPVILPSDGRTTMLQNYSFQLQYQVATDLIWSIGYVGQHATHLHSGYNSINQLNPKYFALGSELNQQICGNTAGVALPYSTYPCNQSVAQALRPFPQYDRLGTDQGLENYGQSTFNALETSLDRRFRNGLHLMFSYTYSKTLTDAESSAPFWSAFAGGVTGIQNPFNLHTEKALSQQDIPHQIVLTYIYELPVGKGKKFAGNTSGAVNQVLGNWTVSGVQRYSSGQDTILGCAPGIPADDNCVYWNRVPGQPIFSAEYLSGHFDPFTNGVFNKAAFSDPNQHIDGSNGATIISGTPYVFGNGPRVYSARSPWYRGEDFALIKRFPVRDRFNLEFQAQFINAFNHHVFQRAIGNGPLDQNPGFTDNATAFGNILECGACANGPVPQKITQLQLKINF
jgi:Carboxypeptidase regulatory-like domain